jgi:D-methionine transport system ATP-binding protein
VTGAVPDNLKASLRTQANAGDRAVIAILWTGDNANEPVLSRLSRQLAIDVNILHGQVDHIGGKPLGSLIVAVPGDAQTMAAVTRALDRPGIRAEVLGYVA